MREGFLIDRFGEFQKDTLFWASGSFGSFMLGREQVYPVTTWRCQHCGLLQCYAALAKMQQGDHAAVTTLTNRHRRSNPLSTTRPTTSTKSSRNG